MRGHSATLAPRTFVFKEELVELARKVAQRERHESAERTMQLAYEQGPHVVGTGEALARLYKETGRTYAAHEIVVDALRHRPNDPRLSQLRTELAEHVPPAVREKLEAD